jgi:tripartite-type tricarboxylate transporter receptor subunit TctC
MLPSPKQPLKLVVPFPPGGGTDVLARMLADKLRVELDQPVVVDNRPGATGNIGAEYVAKAKPDGSTIILHGTIIGMSPHVYAKLNYDPVNDLAGIGMVAQSANVIVVNVNRPGN